MSTVGGVDMCRERLEHPLHVLDPVPARELYDEGCVGERGWPRLEDVNHPVDVAGRAVPTTEGRGRGSLSPPRSPTCWRIAWAAEGESSRSSHRTGRSTE